MRLNKNTSTEFLWVVDAVIFTFLEKNVLKFRIIHVNLDDLDLRVGRILIYQQELREER